METTHPALVTTLDTDNRRHCIRIKARIKIQGEKESVGPMTEATPPYQAYCETVSSSRPHSPDIFTTPPTHSEPFQPAQITKAPTYTARITTRRATISSVSTSTPDAAVQQIIAPVAGLIADGTSSKQDVPAYRTPRRGSTVSPNRYHKVSQSLTPRGSPLKGTVDSMSRNRTPSLSQVQQANTLPKPTAQVITARTPLRQKRYGRMNYHPLPPLPPPSQPPPPPPGNLKDAVTSQQVVGKVTVNFSRGEIRRKSVHQQGPLKALPLAGTNSSQRPTTPPHHDSNLANATAGHERPQSKASRRTVTFADDMTISSRSSSPDCHSIILERSLRQSKSFSSETQTPSSLRQYRSYDSVLGASNATESDTKTHASRRTTPKDFPHKYAFGQRPSSRMNFSSGLGKAHNPNYNPRLSTSKAQYRGLASLPPPLPSPPRGAESQAGPRQPPWGSLDNLEVRREKRGDARERDQVKQFRAATLSEATTLGSTDSFGREKMKREVEDYKEQVMSVYPDMAFDGSAGKEGRRCRCAVM
ncbi:hypothetical protein C7974DRAFT_174519 [Boeremia exigua]|uniref:uncharacterized protein n=1 Tax=Boeremia exigua TaxID=749465 RepID=UPI001E8D7BEB|nr:uncharacterized protein C7974DRAFT_174519 [Boeremia exigua]KAH6633569.1 hypothetical protein C7974DRAFT_174519 [Boeremia exigua]